MFTTGLAIFLGLVFIFIKLPKRTMLRWLRYDVVLDVAVTLIVLTIHFGTFSGAGMSADGVAVKPAVKPAGKSPSISFTKNEFGLKDQMLLDGVPVTRLIRGPEGLIIGSDSDALPRQKYEGRPIPFRSDL